MWQKRFLKFSSIILVIIGLLLLFGKKSWFPNFYNPLFLGVIAVISPLLIYLPKFFLTKSSPKKRKLILEMRSVITFSLLVNFAGELGLFQLYKYGFEYDKFAHFIVSMLFAFILGEALSEWEQLSPGRILWLIFLVVFSSGILWEIFEATSDLLFKTQEWGVYGKHLVGDTYRDIAFNTLGAIAGIVVFMIPKGQREKISNKKSPLKKSDF